MIKLSIRIEASSPHFDDAALIAANRHLHDRVIEATDLADATRQLRALGLDVGHGVGLENASWGYPCAGDKGFKTWHLTDGATRRRLGNNCKVNQIRR